MKVDVVQRENSNIKRYTSTFSNNINKSTKNYDTTSKGISRTHWDDSIKIA